MRIETGPTRTEEDWPGIFIRGDMALHYSFVISGFLDSVLTGRDDWINLHALEELAQLLKECDSRSIPECQIVELIDDGNKGEAGRKSD